MKIRLLLKTVWNVIQYMLHLWQLSLDVLGCWVQCFCMMICCVVLVVNTCGPHSLAIHSTAYIYPLLHAHIVIGEKRCTQQTRRFKDDCRWWSIHANMFDAVFINDLIHIKEIQLGHRTLILRYFIVLCTWK